MSLSLSVAPTNLESLESDVLVVGVYAGEESPHLAPCALSQETVEGINELLEALGATGAADQLLRLPGAEDAGADTIALIGLGQETPNASQLSATLLVLPPASSLGQKRSPLILAQTPPQKLRT